MSDNKDNYNYGDTQHLSQETREDLHRMTLGLTDQKTIDMLTRVGMMAKAKRANSRALRQETMARFEAEKEAAAKKAEDDQKKATIAEAVEDTVGHGVVSDGGTDSDKDNKKKI
jgi:hypothetical protein